MSLTSRSHALSQDQQDPLNHLRAQFLIPSKASLASKTLRNDGKPPGSSKDGESESTYLCGNSLGLQPARTREYLRQYLDTWATKGVYGHFKEIEDSNLPPWLHADDDVAGDMAEVVGAWASEVVVMQTLTVNLHLMMASFFKPTRERWKVILEGKAFPSDHYAVESQLRHHGLDPSESMILIEPPSKDNLILSTEYILSIIEQHASETALLLLPGIQFYTGQLFDMPRITAYAQAKGIVVGWDLAHAAGNVPLKLHDWNVDFAAWCTYKYLNCGPGAIGGCFVHDRHTQSPTPESATTTNGHDGPHYRARLAGWWGSSKSSRFDMTNVFEPIAGARGFQLSNPSVADLASVRASLDVFKQTSMDALRERSLRLTAYLEQLLDALAEEQDKSFGRCFSIITPRDPQKRGAQLSVLLKPGLLDPIMESLEENGVVVDERRPDVIRIAPAPLYNNFADCFDIVQVLRKAFEAAADSHGSANGSSVMVNGGKDDKGWSEIK